MTSFADGHDVTLLETGDEYFPALLEAIGGATSEIHLETYIFADDPTGQRVAQALAAAATRGVHVRVLVDGFGAANLLASIRAFLEPAGVQILVYRPEYARFRLRRHRLRRMHRKLAVIDGRIGFCGGINVLDDRDGRAEGPPRFDYAVRVTGPVVAQMHHAVHRLWMLVRWTTFGGRKKAPAEVRPPSARPEESSGRVEFLTRDSLRNRRAIEEAYLRAFGRARREIFIANAYFLPSRRFREALRDAVSRGVQVRLLLQGLPEYPFVLYAMRAFYQGFLDAGVEVLEYRATFLHAKVAVVDEHWATVGSSNLDPFSLMLSREANVVVRDADFGRELRRSLERALAAGAVAIQAGDLVHRPWLERVKSWLALQLGRLFIGFTGYARREDL
ncbi:MAG: cardiolipin synthase ClsB [Rhodocyclaceae bacterium]|nr:cardiolipin synthase ClsB [Rhodocyclaceae bacterium]